jgi:hypothetical protein
LTTLFRKSLRALAVPFAIGAGAAIFVHNAHPTDVSAVRPLVTTCYWLTFALGAIQISRLVGTVGTAVVAPPSPARLRLGIAFLATGGALASWINLSTAVTTDGFDCMSAVAGGCLSALSCIFLSILRDLSYC